MKRKMTEMSQNLLRKYRVDYKGISKQRHNLELVSFP